MIAIKVPEVYHQANRQNAGTSFVPYVIFSFSINLQIKMAYHAWTENCVPALEKLQYFLLVPIFCDQMH